MNFFVEAWDGICKELSVYRSNPKLFVSKAASVGIFVMFTVITGSVNIDNLPVAAVMNAISQIELYLTPARVVLHKMATEREDNFKEYLIVNGMTKSAYQAKIAVSNYIEMLFFALGQGAAFYFTYHKYFSSPLALLWSIVILFVAGVGVVNMSLFFSTLFSPRTAQNVGVMLILLIGLSYFVAVYKASLIFYIICSFHPAAGLALAINNLLPSDQTNLVWDGYNTWIAFAVLLFSSFCYLALYLIRERDQDQDLAPRKVQIKQEMQEIIIHHQSNEIEKPLLDNHSDSPPHHFEKIQLNKNLKVVIEAKNLKKVYSGFTAINGMSFAIYEKEIFCLLGHNGAGKSTLVNMLTGLIPKTNGIFKYDGEEVFSNLEKIRGLIGFCPQKDFLLMNNTVQENLTFFAKIKKIPESRLDTEIERVMDKLGLTTFKDMPAQKLSGGWKRKLNIGIALLNDPRIIIMDEPTSGMDPVSRRNFWEIIKNLKAEGKTIVLTTQFLDEAEELADRIAILSKGTLFALGSADFIKKRFGSGYKLIIQTKNHDNYTEEEILDKFFEIKSQILSIIPSAIQGSENEASYNSLEFNLPFDEQSKFSQVFQELEKIPNVQISLQMVSLEEAFVSLGMNHENSSNDNDSSSGKKLNSQRYQTPPPPSFFTEKTPTFMDQVSAVLMEKWYKFKSNKAALFFATFPLIFIVGGVVVGNNLADQKAAVSFIVTLLVTGNAFLINTFIVSPVKDRLSKITSILRAMGLQSLPHWLGSLIADMILATFNTVLLITFISVFKVALFQENLVNFGLLYLAFSFNMITYAYNISVTFQSFELTVSLSPSMFLSGVILCPLIANLIEAIFNISILKICYVLSFIFTGPALLLTLGVNHIVPSQYADDKALQFGPFDAPWMYTLVALALGLIQFFRLLQLDGKIYSLKENQVYQESQFQDSAVEEEAEDIQFEKNRLKSKDNNDPIKAVQVQKVYPNGFKALSDLTFGVESGQIFCLLGPNGAGKTTAFEILTAAIPNTAGNVFLNNQPLSRNLDAFYETGICSQSNTLWDYVSVEQHLYIYARFKGLKGPEITQAINYILKALQLEEHAHKGSEQLSGGNKRKLCVAMSMIGAPKLLFLDEPSTGMDPIARRHLWDLIKQVMKQKQGAMVLTTHYMQEAELIGDKLGILINGKFATIGNLSKLRQKFGEYSIVVYQEKLGEYQEEIDKIMKLNFHDSRLSDGPDQKDLTYKVPLESMKFSKIFTELESLKSQRKIKDFTIFTSTLEQIFINFAKNQKNPSSEKNDNVSE